MRPYITAASREGIVHIALVALIGLQTTPPDRYTCTQPLPLGRNCRSGQQSLPPALLVLKPHFTASLLPALYQPLRVKDTCITPNLKCSRQ